MTAILAALLWLVPWWGDRHDSEATRAARLTAVAAALETATDDPGERADLIAIAWDETRLASYVVEGRCGDGRHRCSGGHALGPWQVERWCRAAWLLPHGSAASLVEQARCALVRLRHARAVCRAHGRSGALGGYRGSRPQCTRPRGRQLASIAASVERRLRGSP